MVEEEVEVTFRRRRTSRTPVRPNSISSESEPSLLAAERLVEATDHGVLVPNQAGRLRGPAMDTRFGHDVDPDDVGGSALDSAMDRYEIFHAKKPIRVAELDVDVPTEWCRVGDALAVMYRTDKWKADGTDEDYKHLHDNGNDKPYEIGHGVRFFEPASEAPRGRVARQQRGPGSKPQRLPVAVPKAVTLLGYCLGAFVRRDDDGEIYEINPRSTYLFSSPSGNMLLLYSSEQQPDGSSGFLGAMCGGGLRVLKDGIDG